MLNLALPTGIGDAVWALAVLDSVKEERTYHIPNGLPRRVKPFLVTDPRTEDVVYSPQQTTGAILRNGDHYKKSSLKQVVEMARVSGTPVPFQLNTHLEHGRRIETYFDEPVPSRLSFLGAPKHQNNYAVFYTSSNRTVKAWNGWTPDQWVDLGKRLHAKGVEVISIVGASYDRDMGNKVEDGLVAAGVPVCNDIGKQLSITLNILRDARFVVAFPSGIPILATYMGVPTLMFYPAHLNLMMTAWPSVSDMENGHHMSTMFPTVDTAFGMIRGSRYFI